MNAKLVALTTGDLNGIGFEVTCKALARLKSTKQAHFVLYRSESSEMRHLKLVDKKFQRLTLRSLSDLSTALNTLDSKKKLPPRLLFDFVRSDSPAHWVHEAAEACRAGFFSAMATAPLSKTLIKQAGFGGLGHTDILKSVTKTKNVYMTFLGDKFNVLLATGHIPLTRVAPAIKLELSQALESAALLHSRFKWGKEPIYVLGLNPHAGESGLIGSEDLFIENLIKKSNAQA